MFFLELGKPVQIGKFHHGEWHFLFEQSEWIIQSALGERISSEDEANNIDVAFDEFDLGQLTNASFDSSDVLQLNFSYGHSLKASNTPNPELDFSEWTLFTPDEMCWTKKPNQTPTKHSIHEVQVEQL